MKAIVSEKGQVTIPKILRTKLNIRTGSVLEFEAERGRLVGNKVTQRDIFDELRNAGDGGVGGRVHRTDPAGE